MRVILLLRLGLLLMVILRRVVEARGLRLVLMLIARQGNSLTVAPIWQRGL